MFSKLTKATIFFHKQKLNLHDPDGNDDVPVGGKKGSNTEKVFHSNELIF